jgi:ribulose kinase
VQTYETSGLGTSMTAYVGMGVYKDIDEAMKNMVHLNTEFKPDMEQNKIYESLFNNVYKKMYKQLKPMYCEIHKIINNKDNCNDIK